MTDLSFVLPSAFLMGGMSSLHCAAMCGPLALAGTSGKGGIDRKAALGYLFGRAFAYTMLGAVLGHLGKHALCILPMRALEIAAVVAVAAAASYRGFVVLFRSEIPERPVPLRKGPRSGASAAFGFFAELLPRRGLGLGLATALLPCGALLPAWLLAASTTSAVGGAASMFSFAVASVPGLVLPLVGRKLLERAVTRLPRPALGAAWFVLAGLLILRPLFVEAHCAP